MQNVPNMKTDSNSHGIDIAALVQNGYTGFHLCKLADYYIADT